jgi:DNA polymerase I-like protein with 3'-5' exonuclease and polymerase domains
MILPTSDCVKLFTNGARVLAEVEANGIRIDEANLASVTAAVREEAKALDAAVAADPLYKVLKNKFGLKANVGSDLQLRWLLYTHLKLKPTVFTEKTKTPSVGADALADVDLPFVRNILELERLKKLDGTYLQNIRQQTAGGFVHAFFNLASGWKDDDKGGAKTGRSSSSDPNLQNIPIRNARLGKMIRDCFVPRKGRVLAESDYGALEFKIAAYFWRDPGMVAYASDDSKDIHRDFTALCYSCDESQVSKGMRSMGKNQFVFPVLYGSYYVSCAKGLWESITKHDLKLKDGTGVREHLASKGVKTLGACDPRLRPRQNTFEYVVKEAESKFFDTFPTFAEKKEKWWNEYVKRGGFRMPTGFACNGEYSRNFLMNAPIQGSGFHCLLQSLVWLHDWLDDRKSLIVAQIHDCILKDCVVKELQDVLDATEYFMSVKLREEWDWIVGPLSVEVDVTPVDGTWAQKEPWVKKGGRWTPKD